MRIGDLTGRGAIPGALFGVEVEVEGANLPNRMPGFRVVAEGSLREVEGEPGKEYVFADPVPLNE